MMKVVKGLYFCRGFNADNFEIVYTAALKRLYKEGMLVKVAINGVNYYKLTQKGYHNAKMLLEDVMIQNRDKVINGIRLEILNAQYC